MKERKRKKNKMRRMKCIQITVAKELAEGVIVMMIMKVTPPVSPHGRMGDQLVDERKFSKRHPKRSFRYCQFGPKHQRGCNEGKNCEYWHPRICSSSMKRKKFNNLDCTFHHFKGTRRPQGNFRE